MMNAKTATWKQALALPYVYIISALGLAALAATAPALPVEMWRELALFAALAALAQRMPVHLFRSSAISVAFAITFAALVYLGPAAAVWVNLASALVICFTPTRKPLVKMAFNVGALTFVPFAAGFIFLSTGGVVGQSSVEWAQLPPVVVSILVYFLINSALTAGAIALNSSSNFLALWETNYRWLIPNYVGLGLIGFAMAAAVQAVGLLGLAIFLIPLSMAWYSFKLYMAKTEEVRQRNEQLQLTNVQLDLANVRLRQRVTEMATLNRIGLSLNASLDLSNVLGEIMDSALRLSPAQAAAIALTDPTTGRMAIASAVGMSQQDASALVHPIGAATRAATTGQVVLVRDAAQGEAELTAQGVGALMSQPLMMNGAVGGVFVMSYAGAHDFTEDEERLLSTLAQQAATAVNNARLYQQIEQSYLGTIQAMVSVVDSRERYAAGHSERIRAYAVATARVLGLEEKRVADLELAALFHDIGHFGVPDAVLNKPAALSKEEWEQVRQHPILGVSILRQVPRMEAVVPIIVQHHERYDGMGYPAGLLGSEIDLSAQILAAADAYEAMRSPRPYRAALSREEAVAELTKNAGSQFAPEVVSALVEATAESIEISPDARQAALSRLFRVGGAIA